MDTVTYFQDIIKIISIQGYEARLMALSIVEKDLKFVNELVKNEALETLRNYQKEYELTVNDADYHNSSLHFIDQTIKLLVEGEFTSE